MKILTLDIETAPGTAYVWGTFKQNVSLDQIISPKRTLCWAAKWFGESEILFGAEWDNGDDFICRLHELLDEADAIITYNGKTFDVPHINREFIEMGLTPPSPYAHIDLYSTIRSKFNFFSGKLDHVVQVLELGGKAATGGFKLWSDVLAGDPKAEARMERYNKQDVRITERLYTELRPWISNHPNVNLHTGAAHACPTCGSKSLIKRGLQHTTVSTFQRYQCNDCGTYSRTGKATSRTDLRKTTG